MKKDPGIQLTEREKEEKRKEEYLPEGSEGSGSDPEKDTEGLLLPMLISLALLFLIGFICYHAFCLMRERDIPKDGIKVEKAEDMATVTEAGNAPDTEKDEPGRNTADSGKGGGMRETDQAQEAGTKDLSWQEVIFQDYGTGVISSQIRLGGLSPKEKEMLNFREAEFIRSLSLFLQDQGIKTGAVTITGRAEISSASAYSYLAKISGDSSHELLMIFYPAYPGKVLFILEDEKKDTETKEQERQEIQERITITTGPVPETLIEDTRRQETVITEKDEEREDNQSVGESAYDAMHLKIENVSDELGNYLSNIYEFQYGLYDFLYQKGYRNITRASIISYYIDDVAKEADIQISVEAAGSVSAVYRKDTDTYTFS